MAGMGLVNRLQSEPAQQSGAPWRGTVVRGLERAAAPSLGWAVTRRYNEIGPSQQDF